MHGSNGQAEIKASGSVEKLPLAKTAQRRRSAQDRRRARAQNLPFSGELQDCTPRGLEEELAHDQSRRVPATSRPRCTSTPGRPDHTHIVIVPRPESNVRLVVTRSPQPGIDPGGTIELPMEDVHGRFVFDDGKVTMHDVNFKFRGAPVKFSRGTVFLEDTGRFDLPSTTSGSRRSASTSTCARRCPR